MYVPSSRQAVLITDSGGGCKPPRKILRSYIKEGMTVLDLGCGPGFFSIHLKLLLVAVILMLIGMVIDKGRKIHDENQLTV